VPTRKLIVLDHLQGPLQGSRQVLTGELHGIGTGEDAFIHFPSYRAPGVLPEHAALTKTGESYQISSAPGASVFVNGLEAHVRMLSHGDLIRIGESGPLLKYRELRVSAAADPAEPPDPGFKSIRQVMADTVDVARANSTTKLGTGWRFLSRFPREITSQTSPLARIITLGVLAIIALLLGTIMIRLSTLESRLSRQAAEIVESVGLVQEENQISVDSIRQMRDQVVTTADRLAGIESESGDIASMVNRVSRATVFIQAAYGFSDPGGRMLRATLAPDGNPFRDADGQMLPTFGGQGPILERQYTGTAFVVTPGGLLLTNHHVAEPWLYDEAAKEALARGFKPVMLKMIGFLPHARTSFEVALVAPGDAADLAVLRYVALDSSLTALELSDVTPVLGQSIMVVGYPTGIRALLARTDPAVVDSMIRANPDPDFWEMARTLAVHGLVAPLVTRGIVGQITPTAIVYDAETTHGGSGGPVITMDGRVIAVNTAVVTDFGGSNLGVPIRSARELLAGIPRTEE